MSIPWVKDFSSMHKEIAVKNVPKHSLLMIIPFLKNFVLCLSTVCPVKTYIGSIILPSSPLVSWPLKSEDGDEIFSP